MIRIALPLIAGLVAIGCHARPAPGDKCRVADQLVCSSRTTALVCDSTPPAEPTASAASLETSGAPQGPARSIVRAWTPVSCKGARGCAQSGDEDECDDTLAAADDPCPRNPPLDYACATDLKSALVCKDGRFSLWRRCRGPEGCSVIEGRNVHCDTSLGEPGDPCEHMATFACSVDGQMMLECDGKTLVPASSCRGPRACFFEKGEPGAEPHKIDCDDGLAVEGDPCTQPRRITCALDHQAELVCDGHTFVKKRECHRSECRIEGTDLHCD